MTDVAKMQIVVDLKDKASKQLVGINKQFGKASGGITKSVGAIGAGLSSIALPAIAAVGGIGLAVGKSVSVFADFEKAIANAASVTGATGQAFEDTKKNIEDVSNILGKTTVHSASDAANAFYDLASAGYDVANMTKSDLKPILDIASATQNELSYTTGVVTSTLGQFGLAIGDSGRVADVFAKTIGSSKATLSALENSMKYVGPVANSMGLEIEQVNAILGNLYNAGFKGEQAGTALRGAFSRLLNPTKAMVDQIESMGLTMDDVNPTTHDLADILDTLAEAGMDTSSAMTLFGVEAAPAMLALTSTTPDIRKLERALYDAGGTAETMATQQLDTLSGSFALIKSSVEGVMISIGKEFAPLVSKLADIIIDIIPKIEAFASGIGDELLPHIISFANKLKNDLQPGLDSLKEVASSIIDVLSDLYYDFIDSETAMSSMTSVVDGLVDAFNFLAGAAAAVWTFFADHPTLTKAIGLIAVAIALITTPILAVIAAIGVLAVAWDQNWFGIKDTVVRIADIIVTHVTNKLDLLAKEWDENGAVIMAAVNFAWDLIKASIENTMDLINTAINVVLDIIEGDWKGAWDRIVDFFGRVKERMLGVVDEWGEKIKTAFLNTLDDIIEQISNWSTDSIQNITDFKDKSIQKISDFATDASQSISDWASDTLITISDWATDSIQTISDWATDAIQSISDFVTDSLQFISDWSSDALQSISDWATDALQTVSGWAIDTLGKISNWASDTLDEISTWATDTLSEISNWAIDALSVISNWVSDALGDISNWATDTLDEISTWAADTLSRIGGWATDALCEISNWVIDTLSEISNWAIDTLSEISSWASDALSEISTWATDALNEISNWATDSVDEMSDFATRALDSISDFASDALREIRDWASDALSAISGWASDALKKISGFVSDAIKELSGWFDKVKAFFDFSKYKIKWPKITNPFAGVNFCNYVPSNMKFLFSGCGGSPPHDKSHDKGHSKSSPSDGHDQSSYDRASCSMKDYSGYDRGAIKFQHGGPITKDLNADLHEGEYVVPKKGALVMSDSKPTHVKISYNFGNVYGVNDFEKLLDKHDRKLYRQLESLI